MRITVLGGWGKTQREIDEWKLIDRGEFEEACQAIGKELARRKQAIVIGDDDPVSADRHIVDGMLAAGDHSGCRIELIEPTGNRLYEEEWRAYGGTLFFHHSFAEVSPDSAGAKILSVGKVDAVLTFAGMRKTYDAGLASLMAKKTLVPVGSFGGASRMLLDALKRYGDCHNMDRLQTLNGRWTPNFVDTVLDLLGITSSGKPRVFIGSSTDGLKVAKELQLLLQGDLEVEVWNDGTTFGLSEANLEALERAVSEYDIGIFVFTPDDKRDSREVVELVARDNVVFELGLFTGRLTRWRAFVVHPEGLRLPTDLSGITTATYNKDLPLDQALKPVSTKILAAISEANTRASNYLR